jgi:Sulfotransferase family
MPEGDDGDATSGTPKRPNLFIIGAMKSATGTLHNYLKFHPDVFMCEPKEPCYFVEREQLDWPFIEDMGFWRGEEYYLELFRPAGDATVVGESSTMYTKLPRITGVPERIAEFEPEARLVYIMRDPVDRALSHYWHSVRWDRQRLSPEEALRDDPQYREVSYYAMQLRPYIEAFGRDHVYTLTMEAPSGDPAGTVRLLLEWLGLDPEQLAPPEQQIQHNKTPEVQIERLKRFAPLERIRWSKPYRMIRPLVPASIRRSGRKASSEVIERTEISDDVYAMLRGEMLDQTRELEELLGTSFEDDWATVYS